MLFSTTSQLLAATTLLSNLVSAHPSALPISQRQSSYTVTTGAQGSSGVQPRLEVNQLISTRPEQWSLFVLGLQRWMAQEKGDATGNGYYGIAGIHGIPSMTWGGCEECSNCTQGPNPAYGYCTHSSINFPGWHRAYLALYEQMVVESAMAVAQEYPESIRAQMVDAASKLRIPFWDWAAPMAGGRNFPTVFTLQMIEVVGPNGKENITNPLYQYTFENIEQGNPYPNFYKWKDTLRYPNNQQSDAQSQEDVANHYLSAAQPSLQEQVFNLLTNCPDYQSFSNTNGGSAQCSMSIEGIHNRIHSLTGGLGSQPGEVGGHMAYLPLASFDAAFWMHHANVDRIFALWQTLNPTSYGGSQAIGFSTWTYAEGTMQDATSPLTPFYKNSNGDYWNTNDVRDWATTFNYQYPEFIASDGSKDSIAKIVNAYYSQGAKLTAGSVPVPPLNYTSPANTTSSVPVSSKTSTASLSSGTATNGSYSNPAHHSTPSATKSATITATGVYGLPTTGIYGFPTISLPGVSLPTGISNPWSWFHDLPSKDNNTAAGTKQDQYIANIVTDTRALGHSYTVYVFNGQPQGSPSNYGLASNLIGSVVMFSHGATSNDDMSYGSVPLTFTVQKLVNEGKISSMCQENVLPWLKHNLEWRIVGANGEVTPDQVKDFSISIYSSESEIQPNGLPSWKPVVPELGVTHGKEGGASKIPDFVASVVSGLLPGNTPAPTNGPAKVTRTIQVTATTTICPCKTAAY